jgi:hypothetical protein
MLPWNYGFEWNTGHIVFLGAFYTVLVVVATTVVNAMWRSRRALRDHSIEDLRWHSDFHDLRPADRACRHVLTGEFRERECPNAFDCRKCETHARLTEHQTAAATSAGEEVFGLSFPRDRFYHRGHTWVHPQADGTVTIGLDELGSRLLGTPEAIELPQPGARLQVNGTAFRVKKRNADVRVLSPVDGEVVESGGPGWLLRVRPAASDKLAFAHLLRDREVEPWVLRELERLQLTLTAEGATANLADGGVPVSDIAAGYPNLNWDAVCGEMFLEP